MPRLIAGPIRGKFQEDLQFLPTTCKPPTQVSTADSPLPPVGNLGRETPGMKELVTSLIRSSKVFPSTNTAVLWLPCLALREVLSWGFWLKEDASDIVIRVKTCHMPAAPYAQLQFWFSAL